MYASIASCAMAKGERTGEHGSYSARNRGGIGVHRDVHNSNSSHTNVSDYTRNHGRALRVTCTAWDALWIIWQSSYVYSMSKVNARKTIIECLSHASSALILTITSLTLALPITFLISRSTVSSTSRASRSDSERGKTTCTSTSKEGPDARTRTEGMARIGKVASGDSALSCFLTVSASLGSTSEVGDVE